MTMLTQREIGPIVLGVQVSDDTEPLSPHEVRLLGLLALGLMDKEIAEQVHRDRRTVSNALARLYKHLGIRNRVEATHVALKMGIVREIENEGR